MTQPEQDLHQLVNGQMSVFQLSDERLRKVLKLAINHLRGNNRR